MTHLRASSSQQPEAKGQPLYCFFFREAQISGEQKRPSQCRCCTGSAVTRHNALYTAKDSVTSVRSCLLLLWPPQPPSAEIPRCLVRGVSTNPFAPNDTSEVIYFFHFYWGYQFYLIIINCVYLDVSKYFNKKPQYFYWLICDRKGQCFLFNEL